MSARGQPLREGQAPRRGVVPDRRRGHQVVNSAISRTAAVGRSRALHRRPPAPCDARRPTRARAPPWRPAEQRRFQDAPGSRFSSALGPGASTPRYGTQLPPLPEGWRSSPCWLAVRTANEMPRCRSGVASRLRETSRPEASDRPGSEWSVESPSGSRRRSREGR